MAAKFGLFVDRTIASFLRYTGYLNFINGPIRRMAENGFAPPLGNFADISYHVEN